LKYNFLNNIYIMSAYTPPTEILPIFDSVIFVRDNSPLTYAIADKRYVRIGQSSDTFENVTVNGNLQTNTISPIYTSLPSFTVNNIGFVEKQVISTGGTLTSAVFQTVIQSSLITQPGIYMISGTLQIAAGNIGIRVTVQINISGSANSGGDVGALQFFFQGYPNAADTRVINISGVFRCNPTLAGQTIQLQAARAGTININYLPAGTSLSVVRVA